MGQFIYFIIGVVVVGLIVFVLRWKNTKLRKIIFNLELDKMLLDAKHESDMIAMSKLNDKQKLLSNNSLIEDLYIAKERIKELENIIKK